MTCSLCDFRSVATLVLLGAMVFGSSSAFAQFASSPSTTPVAAPSLGGANLVLDDGVGENGIGLTGGGAIVWLNRFTPPAGDFPLNLVSAEVMFRTEDLFPIGSVYDIFVYHDTDGDPANGATLMGSALGNTVSALDAFNVVTFSSPIAFPAAGDVLIAARAMHTGGQFPAAIDQTTTQARSWAGLGAGADATPLVLPTATFGLIDSFGFPGNWMVRGTYTTGGGGGPVVISSTDTPLAIPDNLPAGVNSVITVAPGGAMIIDDLDIHFDATHSWAGDIRASVAHGATTVVLYDRPGVPASTFGCSGDNPDLVLDDEGTGGAVETSCVNANPAYPPGVNYTPQEPLTAFDGVDAAGTWTLNVSDNAAGDTGTLDSWSLLITPATGGPTVNTYTADPDPNLAIPDNNPTGITSVIIVPPSPNMVVDVDVQLTTTHSWAGDIAANLAHGAASSTFYDRPGVPTSTFGCSGDNPTLTVDDEGTGGAVETSCLNANPSFPPGVNYTPNNPLSVFDGADVEGAWTLTISDNAAGDTGTLNSWSIIVTEELDTAGPQGPGATVASLRALPNPMAASGTIELSVPTTQAVRVALYDMLGREVMVVFDREVAASQRALIGVNTARLESGVYVVRAVGEDFTAIQRVTVTR